MTEHPPSYLHECLSYDPVTGEVHWRERPREHFKSDARWRQFNTRFAGKIAGTISHGYRRIEIDGRIDYAHRIIWAMQTGAWPIGEVDHENRKRAENWWDNLREATHQQNIWNSSQKAGRVLPLGVNQKNGRFRVQCTHNGKRSYLGTFDTPGEAGAAYLDFARQQREGFVP